MKKDNSDITPINEELNVETYRPENIKDLIYTIRGKQVMLDSDVAMLYHYTTKNVNKAMKRNIGRFPEDFCFQLTEIEAENLRFYFGTSSLKTELYHLRASLKDLGKKCFAISKIEDMEYVEKMSNIS